MESNQVVPAQGEKPAEPVKKVRQPLTLAKNAPVFKLEQTKQEPPKQVDQKLSMQSQQFKLPTEAASNPPSNPPSRKGSMNTKALNKNSSLYDPNSVTTNPAPTVVVESEKKEEIQKEQKKVEQKEETQNIVVPLKLKDIAIFLIQGEVDTKLIQEEIVQIINIYHERPMKLDNSRKQPPVSNYNKDRQNDYGQDQPAYDNSQSMITKATSAPLPSPTPQVEGISRNSVKPKEEVKAPEQNWRNKNIDPNVTKKKDELSLATNKWINSIKEIKNEGDEQKMKEIRLKLNLLTPDNYDRVQPEIKPLAKENLALCKYSVQSILEKACTEKKYTDLYAKLCTSLKDIEFTYKPEGQEESKINFQKCVMGVVQQLFEGQKPLIVLKQPFKEMSREEKENYFQNRKNRLKQLMNFIGELHILKLLPFKVIMIVTNSNIIGYFQGLFDPLNQTFTIDDESSRYEDYMESTIELYDKIGKHIDTKSKQEKDGEGIPLVEIQNFKDLIKQKQLEGIDFQNFDMNSLFNIFEYLIDDSSIQIKIKLLLKNLVERRAKNWKEQFFKNEGPKKIEDIRNDYERDRESSRQSAEEYNEANRDEYRGSNNKGRGGKGNQSRNEQPILYEKKTKVAKDDSPKQAPEREESKATINSNKNKLFNKSDKDKEEEVKKYLEEFSSSELTEDLKPSALKKGKQLKESIDNSLPLILKKIYDCSQQNLASRMEIFSILLSNDIWTVSDVEIAFINELNRCYKDISDFPFANKFFVHIYLQLEKRSSIHPEKFILTVDQKAQEFDDVKFVFEDFCLNLLTKYHEQDGDKFDLEMRKQNIEIILKNVKEEDIEKWFADSMKRITRKR